MGTLLHPRMPRTASTPSMPGRPRSIRITSGMAVGGDVQPLLAGVGHHHLVAARREADAQGSQQRGVVVAHQYPDAPLRALGHGGPGPGHGAGVVLGCPAPVASAGGRCGIVDVGVADVGRAPVRGRSHIHPGEPDHHRAAATRGVLGVQLPAHRLHEAPGHGQAEPDTGPVLRVAQALERPEDPVAILASDARSPVDDPDVHPAGHRPGLHPESHAAAVDEGVVDQVGHGPLQQHRIGEDPGQVVGQLDGDGLSPGPEAGHGGLDHVADLGARAQHLHRSGLDPAHVEEVLDQVVEPVGLLVDGAATGRGARRGRRRVGPTGGSRTPP